MANDFLIIDAAFGDDLGTKFDQLCDNGADGFIWRLGQGLPPYSTAETDDVTKQVAACDRQQKPYAFYYPPHPWSDPIAQAQRTLQLAFANGYKPKYLWPDLELLGNMTDAQASANYKTYCYYLRDHSSVPVGVYSGNWCIEGLFPTVKEWIFEFPLWLSSYTFWSKIPILATNWAQFSTNFNNLPQLSYTSYPVIPAYQFTNSDGMKFLGVNADYTKISDGMWFDHLFNNGPKPTPAPVRKYRVTKFPSGTYIRSLPSWNTGYNVPNGWRGYLSTGIILGETTGWWKVAMGWVDKSRAIEIK
jgi:hypothetical protein